MQHLVLFYPGKNLHANKHMNRKTNYTRTIKLTKHDLIKLGETTCLVVIIAHVGPSAGFHGIDGSVLHSSLLLIRQPSQYPDLISQRCNEIIHVKYILEFTAQSKAIR